MRAYIDNITETKTKIIQTPKTELRYNAAYT